MHLHILTVLSLGLLLSSCEDVGSSSRRGAPSSNTPAINGTSDVIVSHVNRTRGQEVLTYAKEIEQTYAGNLPVGIRIIPDLDIDTEGFQNVLSVEGQGRPTVLCGNLESFSGTKARIADCKLKNPATYLWNGEENGASGEGQWILVSVIGVGKEIWQDLKTGMVWSEERGAVNWCKGSGNTQVTIDGVSVDCVDLGKDESSCTKKTYEGLNDDIRWRLPTRNDFLQADLDGLRLIYNSKSMANKSYWTATLDSKSKTRAWTYSLPQGILGAQEISSVHYIRCIGAPRL
jgi:hypothetical protein